MSSMDSIFGSYAKRAAVLSKSNSRFAKGIAWVEGEMVPLADARIPLLDQGFLKSDLTYDVPGVWDGRFFRLEDHLRRFEVSSRKLRMNLPLSLNDIKTKLTEMVEKSGIRDAYVMLILTRGLVGVRGSRPEDHRNLLYMFVQPYIWVMAPQEQRVGGKAIVTRTVRRIPPGSIDPTVKNLQWGDLTRAMFEAADRQAGHPFLTDGDGNLTEGSGFNVVLIKDRVLYSPDRGVLEGVTRKTVFDIARSHGIEVRLEMVPVELAYNADEIFTCTTAGGIMPITFLDGRPVAEGRIGPITRQIWDDYWRMHYDSRFSFAVDYPNTSARVHSRL